MFIMIRDICVARNGAWSANQIFEIAALLRPNRRRQIELAEIRFACGESGVKGGRKKTVLTGSATGSATGSGNQLATGSAKRKKEAKKEKDTYEKLDTSYLAKSGDFGPIEADVENWLEYQVEKRGEAFTLAAARIALSAVRKARAKHGDEWTVATLECAIDHNADLGYFNAIVKNNATGSHVAQNGSKNGTHATGSGTSKYQDIHPAQIELIERLREKGLA